MLNISSESSSTCQLASSRQQNRLFTRVHRRRSAAAECRALADAVLLKCCSSAKKPEVAISAGVAGRDDDNSNCKLAASGQSTETLFVGFKEARELGLEVFCKDDDEGSDKTSEPLGVAVAGDPKAMSELLSLPVEAEALGIAPYLVLPLLRTSFSLVLYDGLSMSTSKSRGGPSKSPPTRVSRPVMKSSMPMPSCLADLDLFIVLKTISAWWG